MPFLRGKIKIEIKTKKATPFIMIKTFFLYVLIGSRKTQGGNNCKISSGLKTRIQFNQKSVIFLIFDDFK